MNATRKPLHLAELTAMLAAYAQRHNGYDDLSVVVETQNGGCPTRYMSPVESVTPGFDWTAGLLIVRCADSLVALRHVDKPLRELARERLDALKSAHSRLSFRYIAKAREEEWIDGFCEGVRQHITEILPGDTK